MRQPQLAAAQRVWLELDIRTAVGIDYCVLSDYTIVHQHYRQHGKVVVELKAAGPILGHRVAHVAEHG